MSECPNCKNKIGLLYLKQNCPHCGVNLCFYNYEENFNRDAKKAELSLARINIFIAHLKASFIGSRLTVARLCVMLLPVASFLVPYGKVIFSQPFLHGSVSLSALGLYGAYEDGYLPYILSMTGSAVNGRAFLLLTFALCALLLAAVAALLIFFLTLLCFLSVKKMHKVLAGTAVAGAVLSALSFVLTAVFASSARSLDLISGEAFPGFLVSVLFFAAVALINILIGKKGLAIVYHEGDEERAAIAKKVRAGELSLADLPQPVVETAETEKIRLEIEKQQALYREREEGDGSA
ncbi:MAG: hypothetical protein IJK23_09240 [Clostridia bacterium]|nr:hypothetical protein [Clostridia bacterium]